MNIDNTGISSLDAGASDITYSGNEGPKSPQQEQQMMMMAQLEQEYEQYRMEQMEIDPSKILPFEEWYQATYEASRQGVAGGGIMRLGYKRGRVVEPGGYAGRWDDPGMSPGTPSGGMGGGQGGGGQGNIHFDVVEQAKAQAAQVAAAKANLAREEEDRRIAQSQRLESERIIAQAKALNEQERLRIENDPRIPQQTKTKLIGQIQPGMLGDTGASMDYMSGTMPAHLGDTGGSMDDMSGVRPSMLGDTGGSMDYMGSTMPAHLGDTGGSMDYMTSVPPPSDSGGDGGLGGTGTNVPGTPIVPTGLTAAESAQAFQDAKEAEIAKVQAAAASGAPFKDYYVGGDPTTEQEKFMEEAGAAASMVGREAWPAARGGRARQRYGLGSLVSSITKPIKKILKSPVGMMALAGLLGGQAGLFGGGLKGQGWKKFLLGARGVMSKHPIAGMGSSVGPGTSGLLSRLGLTRGEGSMMPTAFGGILAASAAPFLFQGKGEDEPSWAGDYGEKLDLLGIRKKILAKQATQEEFPYLNPTQYAAQGGRIGYQDGRSVRSVALNQLYGIMPKRKEAQEGGLMDMGGMEKDYREEGGFVPIGGQERADDVPARLSKNEFVFTADAVRAAGGGDIDKGAEVMENVMNNLEQGGQVSEESQGLEGARNMFATAQRLEGVL